MDIFKDFQNKELIKISGLFLGGFSIICFSFWIVPNIWPQAPRYLSWILNPFGTRVEFRFPSFLANVFSIITLLSLHKRGFFNCKFSNIYGIISFIINVWVLALLYDLCIGRMDNLLEGGFSALAVVALFSISVFGMKQFLPFAFLGIFLLVFTNLFTIDSSLKIPSIIGVITLFLSLVFQYEEFYPKLINTNHQKTEKIHK